MRGVPDGGPAMGIEPAPTGERNYQDHIFGKGGFVLGLERYSLEHHGHPVEHFMQWGVVLDCRGKLRIAPTARFGWQAMLLTTSHVYDENGMGRRLGRTVLIDDYAWITSRAVVYNSHVKEHAIVGLGAIVRNRVVPAWSIVEGNPAVVVGKFDTEKGRYVKFDDRIELMEKF